MTEAEFTQFMFATLMSDKLTYATNSDVSWNILPFYIGEEYIDGIRCMYRMETSDKRLKYVDFNIIVLNHEKISPIRFPTQSRFTLLDMSNCYHAYIVISDFYYFNEMVIDRSSFRFQYRLALYDIIIDELFTLYVDKDEHMSDDYVRIFKAALVLYTARKIDTVLFKPLPKSLKDYLAMHKDMRLFINEYLKAQTIPYGKILNASSFVDNAIACIDETLYWYREFVGDRYVFTLFGCICEIFVNSLMPKEEGDI